MTMNPYEILQVSPDTDFEEIKRIYRKLAMKYHPDVCKDADANEKMARINAAFAMIEDIHRRKNASQPNYEDGNNHSGTGGQETPQRNARSNWQQTQYQNAYRQWEQQDQYQRANQQQEQHAQNQNAHRQQKQHTHHERQDKQAKRTKRHKKSEQKAQDKRTDENKSSNLQDVLRKFGVFSFPYIEGIPSPDFYPKVYILTLKQMYGMKVRFISYLIAGIYETIHCALFWLFSIYPRKARKRINIFAFGWIFAMVGTSMLDAVYTYTLREMLASALFLAALIRILYLVGIGVGMLYSKVVTSSDRHGRIGRRRT